MSKTDRDSAVMEAFYQSASAMMQQAMKRRLGFVCTIDPAKQQAHAKLTDRGETLTETNASVWRQLGLFETKPETKPTQAPTEEPAPVSEAVRVGFDATILANLSDEAVAAFQAITLTDFVFVAFPEPRERKPREAWWTCDALTGQTLRDLLTWCDDFKIGISEREHTTADDAVLAVHLTRVEADGGTPAVTLPDAVTRTRTANAQRARSTRKARAEAPVAYVAQYFGRMTEFDELPVKAHRTLREPLPGHRLEWSEIEVKDTPGSPARTVARCTSEEKDALEKFIRRHHVRGITFRAVKTEGATT